jgi:hypothetical protein
LCLFQRPHTQSDLLLEGVLLFTTGLFPFINAMIWDVVTINSISYQSLLVIWIATFRWSCTINNGRYLNMKGCINGYIFIYIQLIPY